MGFEMRFRPLMLLFAALLTGCGGGYAETSQAFRKSLAQGDLDGAQSKIADALGVDAGSVPSKAKGETTLLLLERATIFQAQEDFKSSARDFGIADQNLDVVDLSSDVSGTIEKYLFSDDSKKYRAPAYEKLLLNTLNLLNYLSLDDVQNAKVEARRLAINKKYLESMKEPSLLALGSYLAGTAFDLAGDASEAMHHYADAYEAGGLPTLTRTVRRLYQKTGAKDSRLNDVLSQTEEPLAAKHGELLIIVQSGIAPYKVAVREPVGAALALCSAPGPGVRLSAKEQKEIARLAAKNAVQWVNYPELVRAQSTIIHPKLSVDGQKLSTSLALDVETKVLEYFKSIESSIIASAFTRMLTRAIAGEVSEAVTAAAINSKDKNKSGDLIGLLVGLAVEGGMSAADTPDTRSWVTLPAQFSLARYDVPTGKHVVRLQKGDRWHEIKIDVRENRVHVINFSDIR